MTRSAPTPATISHSTATLRSVALQFLARKLSGFSAGPYLWCARRRASIRQVDLAEGPSGGLAWGAFPRWAHVLHDVVCAAVGGTKLLALELELGPLAADIARKARRRKATKFLSVGGRDGGHA